jgi:ferric-dicitrate binding protein FerR (iron transport regulator)
VPAVLSALAIAAGIVLGFASWQHHRSQISITFDTGAQRASGHVGAVLAAPETEALPVHFSDGTLVTMSSATVARVTETNQRGATIALEHGSLSLAVVHRAASEWHVAAGPFTVLVTGTKFDVRWIASEGRLTLDLHEGSVTVTGPTLGDGGKRMLPGDTLRVSMPAATGALPVLPSAVDGGPMVAAPAGEPEAPIVRPGEEANALPKDPAIKDATAWRQMALDGHYAQALAAAEAEGFEAVCRRASVADLLLLGDSARFAGSPKRAEHALGLVRKRAVGSHEAAMAAFALGRLASSEQANFGAAARWFQTYLREEPGGRLAREAMGRLIESQSAAGDTAGARLTASAYLAKYPAGPHAGLARSVLTP